jgi:uncharacterized protein YecT (DUF1311 family)
MKLLFLFLLFLPFSVSAAENCEQMTSQSDMAECAIERFKEILTKQEQKLESACFSEYKKVELRVKINEICRKKFKDEKGGSLYITIFYTCLTDETNRHLAELEIIKISYCR